MEGFYERNEVIMELIIKDSGDRIYAEIKGRLDTVSSPQFAQEMMPLMDGADKHIIIDCSGLEYVASSGLRHLMLLRKQTIAMGGDVTLQHMSSDVKQVFIIAGFAPLFIFE